MASTWLSIRQTHTRFFSLHSISISWIQKKNWFAGNRKLRMPLSFGSVWATKRGLALVASLVFWSCSDYWINETFAWKYRTISGCVRLFFWRLFAVDLWNSESGESVLCSTDNCLKLFWNGIFLIHPDPADLPACWRLVTPFNFAWINGATS